MGAVVRPDDGIGKSSLWRCCRIPTEKNSHLLIRIIFPKSAVRYVCCAKHVEEMIQQINKDVRVSNRLIIKEIETSIYNQGALNV